MKLKRADYQKKATPCCGRKPLIYMGERHQFCHLCCRSYDLDTEEQQENWAWKRQPDGSFKPTYESTGDNRSGEYAKQPGRSGRASS